MTGRFLLRKRLVLIEAGEKATFAQLFGRAPVPQYAALKNAVKLSLE
jgi:hypothetical protein